MKTHIRYSYCNKALFSVTLSASHNNKIIFIYDNSRIFSLDIHQYEFTENLSSYNI